MATCANCGRKLRLTDWKQNCPGCGVNLSYFNANERLLADSEKAEIEHARFQPKIDRAKASYAGSWMAIVRIVLTVLPLSALFLPLVKANGEGRNVLKLSFLTGADGKLAFNAGDIFGKAFSGDGFALAFVFLLLAAAMFLITLILTIMALGKHGKIRNVLLNCVQLGFAVASLVIFTRAALPLNMNYSAGIGAYVFIGLIALELIWNLVINKVGIPVKYTVCLIGGLPSDEYFKYVEQGMPQNEIRRKMLAALAELTEKAALDSGEKQSAIKEAIQNNA